jgi:hypothetical protein
LKNFQDAMLAATRYRLSLVAEVTSTSATQNPGERVCNVSRTDPMFGAAGPTH